MPQVLSSVSELLAEAFQGLLSASACSVLADDLSSLGVHPNCTATLCPVRHPPCRFMVLRVRWAVSASGMLMALLSPHRSGISFGLTVRVKEEPDAQAVQAVATAAAAAAAMQGDVERARFLQVTPVRRTLGCMRLLSSARHQAAAAMLDRGAAAGTTCSCSR